MALYAMKVVYLQTRRSHIYRRKYMHPRWFTPHTSVMHPMIKVARGDQPCIEGAIFYFTLLKN